jgi:hypothetical protein
MFFVNIVAVVLIWACIIFRIANYHKIRTNDGDPGPALGVSIICMTPFQFFFSILLLLAELKKVLVVREFFYFLDSKRGRGAFIVFITLTLLDNGTDGNAPAIICAVALLVIGTLNMFLFCYEGSDGLVDITFRDIKGPAKTPKNNDKKKQEKQTNN